MMELADMRDLGSRAERRAGSTPVTRTKKPGEPHGSPGFLVWVYPVGETGLRSREGDGGKAAKYPEGIRPLLPAPLKNHNKSTRRIVVLYAFCNLKSL